MDLERLSEGLKRALCLVPPACLYRPGIAPDVAYTEGTTHARKDRESSRHSTSNGNGSFQVVAVITDYTVSIFGYPNYGNNLRPTIYFTSITDLSNRYCLNDSDLQFVKRKTTF